MLSLDKIFKPKILGIFFGIFSSIKIWLIRWNFSPKNHQILNITKLAKKKNPFSSKNTYVNYGKINYKKIGMPTHSNGKITKLTLLLLQIFKHVLKYPTSTKIFLAKILVHSTYNIICMINVSYELILKRACLGWGISKLTLDPNVYYGTTKMKNNFASLIFYCLACCIKQILLNIPTNYLN